MFEFGEFMSIGDFSLGHLSQLSSSDTEGVSISSATLQMQSAVQDRVSVDLLRIELASSYIGGLLSSVTESSIYDFADPER